MGKSAPHNLHTQRKGHSIMTTETTNATPDDPSTMLATLNANDGMNTWSDEKKIDFVRTFSLRVLESRYVLTTTADKIIHKATQRKFISAKHEREIDRRLEFDRRAPALSYQELHHTKGMRDTSILEQIAEQRAKAILSELPPLKTAVQIIDAETAKKIDKRDKLRVDAQKVADELDDMATTFTLSEVDQDMSIGDFRKMVQAHKDKRDKMVAKLKKLGAEGIELEHQIAKALFAGLPGLSDAVVDTVVDHLERAMALVEIERRVSEQVKFGDSDAAMGILATFEHDEVKVNDAMHEKVKAAMADLRGKAKELRASKRKKASKKRSGKGRK